MIQLTLQERISERIVVLFVVVSVHQIQRRIVDSCWYFQERIQQRTGDSLSTFPYHRWWKKLWKRFSKNRRLVVFTEIDSPLRKILISVEVEKFPRASSSSAGRLRQVAADRARAGEKSLVAHFPARLSMSRLAGSSGTQKVCETTKSRNRTGGRRWSKSRAHQPPAQATTSLHGLTRCHAARVSVTFKSGRSGQSQTPEAMTQ